MGGFIGGDTLGIVTLAPTGDLDSNGQQIFAESLVNVFGCVFEPLTRGPIEEETDTITAHERAWAFFPYIEGVTTIINNANYIRPLRPDALAQRDYKVQGLPEIEYDMDGQPDHVFVAAEWHGSSPTQGAS
jgi:hypothetical protein